MHKKVFIFDFDGTIADTRQHFFDIYNQLAQEFHCQPIDADTMHAYRSLPAKAILRSIKIPFLKIPAFIRRAKGEFTKNISSVQCFTGLPEALHTLRQIDIIMGIVSSNSYDNITQFLKNHNLMIFDFIHSTKNVLGKNVALNRVIKTNGWQKEKVIYIGDEIRDIIAAKRVGIKVASVCWGYNSEEALKIYKPDALIHDPSELLNLISLIP